ncbi:hypothetical protein F4553_004797 [Allocatelliglobosispora scoriae]|uniref:Uncharacterized protein n=1 Tax=Allocatelliglobosispora scoriae TaxID=643052 RepID=A0A841BVE2_9ACTN|nr:hypothetical protein [Allocatelliglobosispora scoriae]MBB5871418.1 hypothetical protein [Allocatelliglobosispora scoriae]
MSVGAWGTSSTTDGRKVGALALPATDQPTMARVVALVNRVRTLNLPGVLRIADLVSHQGKAWLVTASPASPSLATLAGRLTPAAAATIAADTGQTLRQLHAANIVHGALDSSTVIISAAGAAQLNEVGLAAALADRTVDPKEDITAWAALIKQLVPGNATLDTVAAASAAGLETALRVLAATATDVPGFGDRATLTALLTAAAPAVTAAAAAAPKVAEAPLSESTTLLPAPDQSAPAAPAAPAHPPAADPWGAHTPVSAPPQAAPPQAATTPATAPMPAIPATAPQPPQFAAAPQYSAPPAPGAPNAEATRLGQRQPPPQPAPELRFGKGVPSQPPSVPQWTPPAPPVKRRRGILKTLSAVFSAMLTLAVIVVVGIVLWDRFAPNPIVINSVGVADATAAPCSGLVDVVGVVKTNSAGGSFKYQWVKFDGKAAPQVLDPLEQSVEEGQAEVKVHLQWTFSGKGTAQPTATATLRIISPTVHEATGKVSYTCK